MIIVVKRIVALLIATTVLTLIGMGCSSDSFALDSSSDGGGISNNAR